MIDGTGVITPLLSSLGGCRPRANRSLADGYGVMDARQHTRDSICARNFADLFHAVNSWLTLLLLMSSGTSGRK